MSIDQKLSELGLELPTAPKAAGLYKTVFVSGKLATLSGHLPIRHDGTMITGQVGVELSVEEASQAAQMVGLNILASLRAEIDGLDKIERVCKVLAMVNAGSGFDQHPAVINGCSQLFLDVFGQDRGVGTRSAFGVSGLPGNAAVEIEGVFVLK